MKRIIFAFALPLMVASVTYGQQPIIQSTTGSCLIGGNTPTKLYIVSGDTVNATYQWQAWIPISHVWAPVLGETHSTYTVDTFTVDAMKFRLEVTLPQHVYGSNDITICSHCGTLATNDLQLTVSRSVDGSRWFHYEATDALYSKLLLQASVDGRIWTEGVPVSGGFFTDYTTVTGTRFYRLKGIFITGGEKYSETIRFSAIDPKKPLEFQIYSFGGQLLKGTRTTQYPPWQTAVVYSIELNPGNYIFKFFQSGNFIESIRWIKK